jgi:glycine/D-amino acid oxidase-like deaminating enzyme
MYERPVMADIAVIGGGIAGCAAAALLAEEGAAVRLYERSAIGAGASGRNSGILQHPMDAALVPLYEASLELYAALGHGFEFPREPTGTLVVSDDGAALAADHAAAGAHFPDLAPEWLEGTALQAAEPAVGPDLFAYRIATGRPIPPAAATSAWAARARSAGAAILVGEAATVEYGDGRLTGVRVAGRVEPADVVIAAAGPWTPEAIGAERSAAGGSPSREVIGAERSAAGGSPSREVIGAERSAAGGSPSPDAIAATGDGLPVAAVWGVVAQVRLAAPPRHPLEQAGVEALTASGSPPKIFSLITHDGASTVGSTFTSAEPDPHSVAPTLLERGARFVPALRGARIEGVRACARPQSADGRPLLGPVPGVDGLHLITGHGPWGVSLGPASARLVADGVLGRPAGIPPELAAARWRPSTARASAPRA